jgi:hypothetical protein
MLGFYRDRLGIIPAIAERFFPLAKKRQTL